MSVEVVALGTGRHFLEFLVTARYICLIRIVYLRESLEYGEASDGGAGCL